MSEPAGRQIRIRLREPWAAPRGLGLFAPDQRVRTLRRVLVTYPDVRHILPDRIRLGAGVDGKVVETIVQVLKRQHWLVAAVDVE